MVNYMEHKRNMVQTKLFSCQSGITAVKALISTDKNVITRNTGIAPCCAYCGLIGVIWKDIYQ